MYSAHPSKASPAIGPDPHRREQRAAETTRARIPDGCTGCPSRERGLCAKLSLADLIDFAHSAEQSVRSSQTPVFAENQPADFLFTVVSGAVALYKLLPDGRRQIMSFRFPGDLVGLTCGSTFSCSAEAVGPTILCGVPRTALTRLAECLPPLNRRLLTMAHRELATAQDQMLLLGRKTALEKIASFLLLLARRLRTGDREREHVPLPMTRSDIADFLGLTTETVSRGLSRLREKGAIGPIARRRVKLVDRSMLDCLAEGRAGNTA